MQHRSIQSDQPQRDANQTREIQKLFNSAYFGNAVKPCPAFANKNFIQTIQFNICAFQAV